MDGRNRPIQVIKGGEETPLKTPPGPLPPSLEDVALHSNGEALPRLVLRVGGEQGVVRGSARLVGILLRSCTSTDTGFLIYE